MSEMNAVLKTAMAMASGLGRFQGLVSFIRNNPDYYSQERLVAELLKMDDEVQAELDATESELEVVDEQE